MISFLVWFSLSLGMVLPPDREWLRTKQFLFLKQNTNLSPGILPDKTGLCHWIPCISLNLWFFRWPESFHVLLSLPGTFSRLLLQVSLYFYLTNFVGVELIYNVVLVSAVQPSESVTHTSTEHSLLLRNLPWISKPRFCVLPLCFYTGPIKDPITPSYNCLLTCLSNKPVSWPWSPWAGSLLSNPQCCWNLENVQRWSESFFGKEAC